MVGIFIGDTAPSKIFVGGSEVASVWAGDTKVRPNLKNFDYILVGGGGGGKSDCTGGGGGGGAVCLGTITANSNSYCIIIGAGGNFDQDGGHSCIGSEVIARGGCKGQYICGGTSGSGFAGGTNTGNVYYKAGGGGGGGASEKGCCVDGTIGGSGRGGRGICGYGGGGTGGSYYNNAGNSNDSCAVDGGGHGGVYDNRNATNCGGGGGGGSLRTDPGKGAKGLADICYKTDGSCGIQSATGGNCCFTCNGYKVHRFTSNGTFTITG